MQAKAAILAGAGAIAGAAVALVVFVVFMSGNEQSASSVAATPEPTLVATGAKLGPRIELRERVLNLASAERGHVYLKLRTVIEFETKDGRWATVIAGCVRSLREPSPVVSRVPAGAALPTTTGQEKEKEEANPCGEKEGELLHEFQSEVGTGVQLIEDAVTMIVTSKTAAEVSTPDGKQRLKDELKGAVEEILGEEFRVSRILFTTFITQ